jgi:hypothetical protein
MQLQPLAHRCSCLLLLLLLLCSHRQEVVQMVHLAHITHSSSHRKTVSGGNDNGTGEMKCTTQGWPARNTVLESLP